MDSQSLTIELDDEPFEVVLGDNLLSSLLSQGADVRYGCCAGVCGACCLYDTSNGESILSCQTAISSSMSLTRQIPAETSTFSVLNTLSLNGDSIELTLLGPSDESFGDRVVVSFSFCESSRNLFRQSSNVYECMVLNSAGAPLKIVLQKERLFDEDWLQALMLSAGDPLAVQLSKGIRKGRLLFEMDIADAPVVVIASPDNALLESYWRESLLDYTTKFLGHFTLLANETLAESLADDALTAFLQTALANSGGASLQLIYHGQNVSAKDWNRVLRPLRIHPNQLHFVR